jgi:hypothetical protein
MATQYWVGATSGDVSTAANWNNGTSIGANDKVIFDSAAQGDVTSGSLAGPAGVAVALGPGFRRSIGTPSAAIPLQATKAGGVVAFYMEDGFAHVSLKTAACVVAKAPKGDQLLLDGAMTDVSITAVEGRVTFKSSTDITTMVVAPPKTTKQVRPEIIIEGGAVDNLFLMGPCFVEDQVGSVDNLIICHEAADYKLTGGTVFGGSGTCLVSRGSATIDVDTPVVNGEVLISNGQLLFEAKCRLWAFASGSTVDIFRGGLLDTELAQNQTVDGTVTSYGGVWNFRKPGTVTIPGDTKLSSTSGRSLDFSVAANSGHYPTVLH